MKKNIEMLLLVILLVSLSFFMFIRYKADIKQTAVCKEALEILKNQEPENNYCKAWCLMYD